MPATVPQARDIRLFAKAAIERSESQPADPFLGKIRDDRVTRADIRRLIETELGIIDCEAAAYRAMAMRWFGKPQDVYCTRLLEMVQNAKPRLVAAAGAEGIDARQVFPHDHLSLTRQAYGFYLSWLALNGTRADIGLASYLDVQSYYLTHNELAAYLRKPGRETLPEVLEYYRHVDADGLLESALAFGQAGLDEGDDPDEAVHLADLMRDALHEFWAAGCSDSI
jgi:hypothetical protein